MMCVHVCMYVCMRFSHSHCCVCMSCMHACMLYGCVRTRYVVPSESSTLPPLGYRPLPTRAFLATITSELPPTHDNDDAHELTMPAAAEGVSRTLDFKAGSSAGSTPAHSKTAHATFLRFRDRPSSSSSSCSGNSSCSGGGHCTRTRTSTTASCLRKIRALLGATACSVLRTSSAGRINKFLLFSGQRQVRVHVRACNVWVSCARACWSEIIQTHVQATKSVLKLLRTRCFR